MSIKPRSGTGWKVVFLLIFFFVSTGCTLVWSASESALGLEQVGDSFFIKGQVQALFLKEKEIVIKPNKGRKVTVRFTENTTYSGFSAYGEIKKKRMIKVWYRTLGANNIAVKIEILPDLGC